MIYCTWFIIKSSKSKVAWKKKVKNENFYDILFFENSISLGRDKYLRSDGKRGMKKYQC